MASASSSGVAIAVCPGARDAQSVQCVAYSLNNYLRHPKQSPRPHAEMVVTLAGPEPTAHNATTTSNGVSAGRLSECC
jgi:hypothetical protein